MLWQYFTITQNASKRQHNRASQKMASHYSSHCPSQGFTTILTNLKGNIKSSEYCHTVLCNLLTKILSKNTGCKHLFCIYAKFILYINNSIIIATYLELFQMTKKLNNHSIYQFFVCYTRNTIKSFENIYQCKHFWLHIENNKW